MTLNRLFSLIVNLLTWGSRVAAHRHVMASLGGLDDRELADIGLNRQDLRDASALPLSADPGELLAIRAGERAEASLAARRRRKVDGRPPDRERRARIAAE